MNWFERYGIVGMSFFVFLGIFLFIGGNISIQDTIKIFEEKEYLYQIIGGIVTFSFLPIGYIIMIIFQKINYCKVFRQPERGLHQRILKRLKELNIPSGSLLTSNDSEADIEVDLTYIDRMTVEPFEKRRSLDEFIRKRFDVIAINRGIITAYLISLLIIFFMKYLIITYYLFLVLIIVILFMALLQKTKFSLKNLCLVKYFLETSLCRNCKNAFIEIRKGLGIAGIIIAFLFAVLLLMALPLSILLSPFLKEFLSFLVQNLFILILCIILPIILLASNHTLEQQIIKVEEEIFRNNKVNK